MLTLKSSLTKCSFRFVSTNAQKVVVITGCDTGLGYTLAQRCLSEKAIVLAGCLNADGVGARYLEKQGALVRSLDVTNADQIQKFKSSLAETLATRDCRKFEDFGIGRYMGFVFRFTRGRQ